MFMFSVMTGWRGGEGASASLWQLMQGKRNHLMSFFLTDYRCMYTSVMNKCRIFAWPTWYHLLYLSELARCNSVCCMCVYLHKHVCASCILLLCGYIRGRVGVCVQQRAIDPLCFGELCFGCLPVDRKVPFREEWETVWVEPHTECNIMNGLILITSLLQL